MEGEVVHVELKAAVIADTDELVDLIGISTGPERSHAHHFVFALVNFEPQESRKGAVEKAQGMGEANLFEQLYLGAVSYPKARSRPLAHAVHRENRRFFKRGTEKGAGSVGEMMLAEKNFGGRHAEPFLNEVLDPEFITEPGNHRLAEDPVRAGKGLHAG